MSKPHLRSQGKAEEISLDTESEGRKRVNSFSKFQPRTRSTALLDTSSENSPKLYVNQNFDINNLSEEGVRGQQSFIGARNSLTHSPPQSRLPLVAAVQSSTSDETLCDDKLDEVFTDDPTVIYSSENTQHSPTEDLQIFLAGRGIAKSTQIHIVSNKLVKEIQTPTITKELGQCNNYSDSRVLQHTVVAAMPNNVAGALDSTTIEDAELNAKIETAKPRFVTPDIYKPAKTSVHDFLRHFERCASSNGWNYAHKIRYFSTFLDGAANTWFVQYAKNEDNIKKTWDQIKKDFIGKFGWEDTATDKELKLRTLKQGESEGIKDFYYRLIEILNDQDKEYGDREVQINFELGIHKKYLNAYNLVSIRNMSENQLKEVIHKLDKQVWTDDKKDEAVLLYTAGTGTQNSASRGSNKSGERDSQKPTRTVSGKPICYSCGKPGHFQQYCYQQKPFRRGSRKCHGCGGEGHLVKNCWERLGTGDNSFGGRGRGFSGGDFRQNTTNKPWGAGREGNAIGMGANPSGENSSRFYRETSPSVHPSTGWGSRGRPQYRNNSVERRPMTPEDGRGKSPARVSFNEGSGNARGRF